MPAQFILGRAGSGKTRYCFQQIVEMLRDIPLGPPIYWLLPRQATFQAERMLACESGLAGYSRVRVVSIEQFGQDVLTEAGGLAVPVVSAQGRRMIIGHLLRRLGPDLHFFHTCADQIGLAQELDSVFADLERSGTDPETIAKTLEDPDRIFVVDDTLQNKLYDLRLIYAEYQRYLGQDRLDPKRRLDQVLAGIRHCPSLHSSTVFVDAFFEFTDHERRILATLASICTRIVVTAMVDPDNPLARNIHLMPAESSPFHRTELGYRQLYFSMMELNVSVSPPLLLHEPKRFRSNDLLQIEQELLTTNIPSKAIPPSGDGLELLETPNRQSEVEAVARRIVDLLRAGERLRHIAVLTRSLDDYNDLLQLTFGEHGIPYFADQRRPASHHSLIRFFCAVLDIARLGWQNDAVFQLLRSGLAGLTSGEIDELENYVLQHRLRDDAWIDEQPWHYALLLTRGSEDEPASPEIVQIERIHDLRMRFIGKLKPILQDLNDPGGIPVKVSVRQLFAVLEAFDIRLQLEQAMTADDLEHRGETEQVWKNLVDLLAEMSDLFGDEILPLERFVQILFSGLEGLDLALAPPAIDQVLVGDVDRTRTGEVKTVIILGMNEGQFPRVAREGSVFSDFDRRSLSARNVQLDPDSRRQLLDEWLLGYFAFTRPSQRLILTRSLAEDNGRPSHPSALWRRVTELLPEIPINRITQDQLQSPRWVGSARQLVTSLLLWVQDGADIRKTTELSLYDWLRNPGGEAGILSNIRDRVWPSLSYQNDARLIPGRAAELYRQPLVATPAQIESFASCPFQHYSKYALELRGRPIPDITGRDLSGVYHRVLQQVITEIVRDRVRLGELSPDAGPAMIHQHAKQIAESLKSEFLISNARNRYLLTYIEKTLGRVLSTQQAVDRRSDFSPRFLGLEFSPGGRLDPLVIVTPAQHTVELHGRIDRVDVLADQAAFAVFDYKLRSSRLALDRVYHGLSLQLLTYLLVIQANGQKLVGKPMAPAGAFYAQLLRTLDSVDTLDKAPTAGSEELHLDPKPRGVLDEQFIRAFDRQFDGKQSTVIAAAGRTKEGAVKKKYNDALPTEEFHILLKQVHATIGRLVDDLLDGNVAVSPYRINQQSPCAQCDFMSVCRFEQGVNHYHHLKSPMPDTVATAVNEGNNQ